MSVAQGTVHGRSIELERPVPELDGRRVRVHLEVIDDPEVTADQQHDAWAAWVERGPHGPLDEEDGADWP